MNVLNNKQWKLKNSKFWEWQITEEKQYLL